MKARFAGKKYLDEVLDTVHNLDEKATLTVDYSFIVMGERRKIWTLFLIRHDQWYLRVALMLNGKRIAERSKRSSRWKCMMARGFYWSEVWSWVKGIKAEQPDRVDVVGKEDDKPWDD